MRILAANPDGLGDLMLRQPLYAALRAAGHELMLTVRGQWIDLASHIAPGSRLGVIETDPYRIAIQPEWEKLQPLLAGIRKFAPDVFLIAPFQWTLAEEWLAAQLPRVRVVGLKGYLYGNDPRWGVAARSSLHFDKQVDVPETSHELVKNHALAVELLGEDIRLGDPKLAASGEFEQAGRAQLNQIGWKARGYYIASVGNGPYSGVKNWHLENWADVLAYWARRYKRRFLLVGTPEESDAAAQVCEAIESGAAVSLCQTGLKELIGLVQLSRGFVGRDTGPMHLAAAAGKPVIALFGGGHWPRFQPAANPSWVATVEVPCAGCDWHCPFDRSYCIKEIPVKVVRQAIDDLESRRLKGRVVRVLKLRPEHDRAIGQQAIRQIESKTREAQAANSALAAGAASVKGLLAQAEQLTQALGRQHAQEIKTNQAAVNALLEQANKTLTVELAEARSQLETAGRQLSAERDRLGVQLESARSNLAEAGAANAALQGQLSAEQNRLAELAKQRQEMSVQLESARSNLAEAGAANAALQGQLGQATRLAQQAENALEAFAPAAQNRNPWPYAAPAGLPLPATLPGGRPWPRISIVTPSYNQGRYIEQTLLSVINQRYPDVQHIVIDGGSSDETMSVIDRYRDRLSYVVSEKDRGQSHAINKGFAQADGEILMWLNSDDMLEPDALAHLAMAFHTSGADMVAGVATLHKDGQVVGRHLTACPDGTLPLDDLLDLDGCWQKGQFFYQPEVAFTRDLWQRAGGHVQEDLYFSMDYELWVRFAEVGARLHPIGAPVARFRVHDQQKTGSIDSFYPELLAVRDRFAQRLGKTIEPGNGVCDKTALRVVFLNDLGDVGGAAIAHQRLAAALATAGHEVMPLAIAPRLIQSQLPNQAILQAVEQRTPDLVILGNLHAAQLDPALIGLLSQRWTTIQVLHDFFSLTGRCPYTGDCTRHLAGCDEACPTAHEYPALDPSLIRGAWEKKHAIMTSESAPILAAVSDWARRFAQNRFDNAAPHTMQNGRIPRVIGIRTGLPVQVFRRRDKSMCRDMLGLPQDRFIVLFSSAYLGDQRKGLDHLIAALESLRLPNLLAACIGHFEVGPKSAGFEIRNMGYIRDPETLAALYSAVDLFVGPSQVETFGQVFIEAAACGTPSVGYGDAGGVAESIRDGLSGALAVAHNSAELARTIQGLHDQAPLRQDMAAWGAIWVENEFSFRSAYQRLFAQLNQAGIMRKLGIGPKVSFLHDMIELPKITFLEVAAAAGAPAEAASATTEGSAPLLAGRLATAESERDSLRLMVEQMRQTRLWRMVAWAYPKYQRFLGNLSVPRFVRRGAKRMGDWLGGR